jgi:hypothetical protein
MTSQFRLTQPAIQDIEQIADYIADRSGLAQSEKFLEKLNAKFSQLTQFPNLGRQFLTWDDSATKSYLASVASRWKPILFSTCPSDKTSKSSVL